MPIASFAYVWPVSFLSRAPNTIEVLSVRGFVSILLPDTFIELVTVLKYRPSGQCYISFTGVAYDCSKVSPAVPWQWLPRDNIATRVGL